MNETDYAIAEAILDEACDGTFDLEVELGDNTWANVCVNIETESYQEDDYYSGTGAWVTTYASVVISSLELVSYDEDGNEIPCTLNVHEDKIEDYCKQQLLN